MQVAEGCDPGDCRQQTAPSALGIDRSASENKQRRQRGNHNYSCKRNSHLDCNFEDCRVSIVPHTPTVEIVTTQRGKQILKGANSGSQKRPPPDGLHAKSVDGPPRIVEQTLASNSAHSAKRRHSGRQCHACPNHNVPESPLSP